MTTKTLLPWISLSVCAHLLILGAWRAAPNSAPSLQDGPLRIALVSPQAPIATPRLHRTQPPISQAAHVPGLPQAAQQAVERKQMPAIPRAHDQASAHAERAPAVEPRTAPNTVSAADTLSARKPPPVRSDVKSAGSNIHATANLQHLLHTAISRHKRYPLSARRTGREGIATVDFVLLPDGRVDEIRLWRSTGMDALDRAALDAVRRINPFLAAQSYLHDPERFRIAIVFDID